MEVEARMKRNYMPPMMPQRKHSRHAVKPHLPTVQELQVQGKYRAENVLTSFFKRSTIRWRDWRSV